jgi:hypothetical protein
MKPRLLALLLCSSLVVACQREATKPTSKAAATGEGAFGIVVQPLAAPAQGESAQAQLTASSRGVLLSWLEQKDATATLKFAELAANAWSAAHQVASSDQWFISDADVPTVMRMSNGTLVATTYPSVDPTIEAYDLRLAYSRDDGKTWSRPLTPHHDKTKTQHGFASPIELPDRSLGLVWLDGRDQELNKTDPQGGSMDLYFASFDSGWKQTAESSINRRVCECCQTAATVTDDGPVVVFRDRTEQDIRDIHVTRIEQGKWMDAGAVHADNWHIDACPVNGPAVSARGRTVAVAWFTAVGDMGHAYAAFSPDAGRTWGMPIRLDDSTSLGHVDIELLEDGSAAASWVEFANERAQFRVRQVKPSGERSQGLMIAGAGEGRVSGYPRIARSGHSLVFAWTESAGPGSQQVKTAIATTK